MKDKMKLSVNNREGTLIITIAVIFVAMCILKGELFYARSNIEAIFSNLAYDLLLACGMTFVIILGGVDLSVGAVLALSGIICTLMIQKGINIVLAVGLGILLGCDRCGQWYSCVQSQCSSLCGDSWKSVYLPGSLLCADQRLFRGRAD